MADLKKLLHTFDEADEILNGKIERTNLSTIVASATASVENKKTVLIRGTGRNIESLKVGGRTVQDGTPTPDAPVEVKGVGDGGYNIFPYAKAETKTNNGITVTSDGLGSYHIKGTSGSSSVEIPFTIPTFTIPDAKDMGGTAVMYLNNTVGSSNYSVHFKSSNYDVSWACNPVNRVVTSWSEMNGKSINTIAFWVYQNTTVDMWVRPMFVIDGRTDHDFVPYYKYKIPVSCNGEITNIYLDSPVFEGENADLVGGTVEKKYDILKYDGTESGWEFHSVNTNNIAIFRCLLPSTNYVVSPLPLSNRLPYAQVAIAAADSNSFGVNTSENKLYVRIQSSIASTLDELKSWLSNNNLQVVFYKNTSTTESFDTSPIPTASGNNELSIDTEVTPATIDVTTFGDYYSKAEVDKMINNIMLPRTLTFTGTTTSEGYLDSSSTSAGAITISKNCIVSAVANSSRYNVSVSKGGSSLNRYAFTVKDRNGSPIASQEVEITIWYYVYN